MAPESSGQTYPSKNPICITNADSIDTTNKSPFPERLASHRGLKHLGRQFTQESRPIWLWKVQENLIDAFPLGVANGAQTIACHSTGDRARKVAHDEAQSATTDTAYNRPEPRVWTSPSAALFIILFSKPLFPQHLLEHRAELIGVTLIAITESKAGPWEATGTALGNLLVDLRLCLLVCASLVVLSSPCRVR